MYDFSVIFNNNWENNILNTIYDNVCDNILFFQNNEGYSMYLENNLKTDFNSKNQISNQNNNQCLNELSNIFKCQTENNLDKEENEAINKDKVYFINEKRKDEDIKIEKKKIKKNNLIEDIKNENDEQKILGRKMKNSDKKGKHNKTSKDNIINKIKTDIFNCFIILFIKETSINKSIELKKLPTKGFISDLSKKNNESLFNMKISEILSEQPISTKYSTFDRFENKKIIDEIYDENIEKNVIKILELTFEELLIIYRIKLGDSEDKKKLEKIKDKIEGLDFLEEKNRCKGIEKLIEKLEKKHEEEYIKKVKTAVLGYKNYFINKKERKHD